MMFISHAQNFEDVMLWRALKHVAPGFYIDVGAMDPRADSVTCAFYERNWHGLNIEPAPDSFQALAAARPRDVNLRIALGALPGRCKFFMVPQTGLSTVNESRAAALREAGWQIEEIEVEVATLAEICRRHAEPQIHFLKIDVEGAERAVLGGADFVNFRPWIVVVEATVPSTPEPHYEHWEPLLLAADYRFVWFDGLNRYYLAAEHHGQLSRHFLLPPNAFDRFRHVIDGDVVRELEHAQLRANEAESRASTAESRASEAESRAGEAESRAAEAEAKYAAVLGSRSWRLTRPLRSISGWARQIKAAALSLGR